jgi:hypothetical protein
MSKKVCLGGRVREVDMIHSDPDFPATLDLASDVRGRVLSVANLNQAGGT